MRGFVVAFLLGAIATLILLLLPQQYVGGPEIPRLLVVPVFLLIAVPALVASGLPFLTAIPSMILLPIINGIGWGAVGACAQWFWRKAKSRP